MSQLSQLSQLSQALDDALDRPATRLAHVDPDRQRRVRHEIRDGAALVCFSLLVSSLLTLGLLLLTRLGH